MFVFARKCLIALLHLEELFILATQYEPAVMLPPLPDRLIMWMSIWNYANALLGTDDIPPLTQTLEEVSDEFEKEVVLKATIDGKIVGSVRVLSDNRTCYIGKLIVSPEHQGKGYGTGLLAEIEKICQHQRYELFTSDKSSGNIRLYERAGYRPFHEQQIKQGLRFVYLEKLSQVAEGELCAAKSLTAGNRMGASSPKTGMAELSPECSRRRLRIY